MQNNYSNEKKSGLAKVVSVTGLALEGTLQFTIGATMGSTCGSFSCATAGKDIVREDMNSEYFLIEAHRTQKIKKGLDTAYVAGRTVGQLAMIGLTAYYLMNQ